MHTIDRILEEKGRQVHRIGAGATVLAAVEAMCAAKVGAVLVCGGDRCEGIFSERDLMTRVILEHRDPRTTTVGEVMSRDVVVVEPHTDATEAMAIMTERRCRHLPVVSDGRVVGVVSIGDLVRWQSRNHEFEIRMLTDYISGKYPG